MKHFDRIITILNSIKQYICNAEQDSPKENTGLDDSDVSDGQSNKPGLWENIRRKKEREGKNYRPAKPGDKDRPDPDQWKKLTKKN